ncbi:SGNH/GDSL hydrolase family protein [Spirillospora sp. NPDC048911]|uniref:SGNH/GDSL hydrolase family protein n=1 Tax=Spirillospora sp. NPDC048911 TaxID=3364527 RepID=UPI003720F14E
MTEDDSTLAPEEVSGRASVRDLVTGLPGRARERFGDRGLAVALLVGLMVAMIVPLVALPAVRCEAFGDGNGCRARFEEPRAEPVRGVAQVAPAQVAVQGSYVALGDSYSAGVGADLAADLNPLNRCHRTGQAYYHAVAKAFRFARGSAFWACSGATTSDVMQGKSGEPPQIGRIDQNTSLVTISIGGNDVGFSKVLAGCVIKLPWGKGCEEQGRDIADRMATLRQELPGVLKVIRARAPQARVIVLGYPRAFKETSGTDGDNISVSDQQWLNGRARDLNELLRQAVIEADARIVAARAPGSVEFVDAYSAFAGHEVGTADPYMNGLAVDLSALTAEKRSYHPTANGYKALARLFIDQVNRGPGRPLNPPR